MHGVIRNKRAFSWLPIVGSRWVSTPNDDMPPGTAFQRQAIRQSGIQRSRDVSWLSFVSLSSSSPVCTSALTMKHTDGFLLPRKSLRCITATINSLRHKQPCRTPAPLLPVSFLQHILPQRCFLSPSSPPLKATKAAEAEALRHLRSLTNASARVLSASWFSLLGSANAGTSAHGGHGHGSDGLTDEHTGGGAEGVVSVDATVLGIAVRRFVRSCGILQGTAGAPTLAHADMELQRNAVGKGGRSVGHRGVR